VRRRRMRDVGDAHELTRTPAWTAPRLGPIERLYRRTLGRLARAGWPRLRSETPREYARRIDGSGLIAAAPFRELTERYAAARFGGHEPGEELISELAAKLAIRTGSVGHPGSAPPGPRA